ncbi:MAG: low affinity iron permease family protein [Mesorhizobium sp.]
MSWRATFDAVATDRTPYPRSPVPFYAGAYPPAVQPGRWDFRREALKEDVVLIQGYRDTAAIHAKLDEIVVSLKETRNDVVGLEKEEPEKIRKAVEKLEREALSADRGTRSPG